MTIRQKLCVIAACVATLFAIGVVGPTSTAGATAADGCSTSLGGTVVASSTIARCTGGYRGLIGYFRAKQKCHFGIGTQTQYGPWVVIGAGRTSETALCGGLWSDSSGYELKGP